MKPITSGLLLAAFVLLGVLVILSRPGGVAPTPAAFDQGTTLSDAVARSESEGKPVLVLATADWCPPCQTLKRETLADSRVGAFIDEHMIAVNLEDASNSNEIMGLGVTAYPTTIVLRGGTEVARSTGFSKPDAFLEFLNTAGGVASGADAPVVRRFSPED